jgi:hypothetical protein
MKDTINSIKFLNKKMPINTRTTPTHQGKINKDKNNMASKITLFITTI